MNLERDDLAAIVERASTLWERLGPGFAPRADDDPAILDTRLRAWQESAGNGDRERFLLRLSWDGLTLGDARRAVGNVRLLGALPPWAELLRDLVAACGAMRIEKERFFDPVFPVPFEDLLAPMIVTARERVRAASATAYPLFGDRAHAMLERSLLGEIAGATEEILLHQFDALRGREQTGLARLLAMALDPDSRELYQRFVASMRDGGLRALLLEYPALARRIATTVTLWIESTAELLQRLERDRDDLETLFGKLGIVVATAPSLSDTHNGGRTVCALTFASGVRIVYKPKHLGAEDAFHRLLGWINERGELLPLRALRVLPRGAYGWVEFVEHESLHGTDAAHRYFERGGMLLCLAFALEGTDCHYENLIAGGEHPMLIDVETLMHHRTRMQFDAGAEAQVMANEALEHSALRTGMLPRWEVSSDDSLAFDVSGLGTQVEQEVPVQQPKWQFVNTDRMAIVMERGRLMPRKNVPQNGGVPLVLDDYADDVVRGFEAMYRFLMSHRGALLADGGPIRGFGGQPVRYVFRPTRTYALVEMMMRTREHLRDGVDRSIALDILARYAMPPVEAKEAQKPDTWPLLPVEYRAMERGDVPFFTALPESDSLVAGPGVVVEHCFIGASLDAVLARFAALSEADLELQLALIQGSFYANAARASSTITAEDLAPQTVENAGTVVTEEDALQIARAIAKKIAEHAMRSPDGGAAWIAPQYLVRTERYQLQPVDYSLYGGTAGIALFLAALERVTGGAGYRDLALGALRPLRWAIDAQGSVLAGMMGLGGATGIGSFLYGFVRISQLLDEPSLLDDARKLVPLVSDERIVGDRSFDIVSGGAGAILGLLALYEATGDAAALERAVACGRRLVEARKPTRFGPRSWSTFDGQFTTGLSHGAAGIAYSLLRLRSITGDEELGAAAREAIEYESHVYSPETGNWADFKDSDDPLYVWSWCHGAPGIGLARVASLPYHDDARMHDDLRIALGATRDFGLRLIDHLCCGNMGRVEVMLTAGEKLDRPDLVAEAHRLARQVVARAEKMDAFLIHPMLPKRVHNPSFFQGTAGIGYQLLRMVRPRELPSVLMWE